MFLKTILTVLTHKLVPPSPEHLSCRAETTRFILGSDWYSGFGYNRKEKTNSN